MAEFLPCQLAVLLSKFVVESAFICSPCNLAMSSLFTVIILWAAFAFLRYIDDNLAVIVLCNLGDAPCRIFAKTGNSAKTPWYTSAVAVPAPP
jgi:hypothetical protein